MEKRTVLAFVLSFIVLIAWSYFFAPKQELPPKKNEGLKNEASEKIKETSKPPASTPSRALQPPLKPERAATAPVAGEKIEIDTPLYRAVFSNAGPSIVSFQLKKYRQSLEPESPLIELVNVEKEVGDSVLVGFDNQNTAQYEKRIYEVDSRNIQIGPESSPRELVFRSNTPNGLSILQTFRFYPDKYRIDLTVNAVNQSEKAVKGQFRTDIKAMPPKEKHSYYSYVGFAILLNDKLEEVKIKKVSDEKLHTGRIGWVGYEDAFFISAVVPDNSQKGTFKAHLLPSGLLEGALTHPSISVEPSAQVSSQYALYLGPRDLGILKQFGKKLDKAVNFGWTDIIAKPLLYLLRFFNQYIHNYGMSIIILTILIKILFWPLTHKSYKSMKEMQKLQPRMAKIREKYKDNKEQLNKEMMALYKTYKVNPMGGCLPMIIQIPVFFALFRLLGNSIELRHAPFMLWITDLSAPDRLFDFGFKIPLMSPPYGIPVLTLLMGASMFMQQKMTPTPGDPTQAKIMMFLPLIFTFMFINFPSGLVLYWLVNNILSIGQQYRINKKPA